MSCEKCGRNKARTMAEDNGVPRSVCSACAYRLAHGVGCSRAEGDVSA